MTAPDSSEFCLSSGPFSSPVSLDLRVYRAIGGLGSGAGHGDPALEGDTKAES